MISTRSLVALASLAAICGTSYSQSWTVQFVHPAGYSGSAIWSGPAANEGPYYGGEASFGSSREAAVFDSSGLLYLLSVPGSTNHLIAGSDGNNFAGWATFGSDQHAITWKAAGPGQWNAVDLHVLGASSSQARDTFAGNVVGSVTPTPGGSRHAAFWKNNSTYVDLHPQGRTMSEAYSMDARFQVGHSDFRAAIWRGTRRSFRDAHPAGYVNSYIYKADGGIGYGYTFGPDHAMIWDLKNGKYRDIHPAGAGWSWAFEGHTELGLAAGLVDNRAALWTLSTGTVTDLHSLLPAGYFASEPYSIWRDGALIRVGGFATTNLFTYEAVVWTLG